jgi:hypothetical protein
MDLIKSSAKLKPEVRLGLAISAFKASLNDEKKKTFQTYCAQAHDRPPDPQDISKVIAEINKQAGKPLGPRVEQVLKVIQQFSVIGDAVIGGSQSNVASGVWAAVKLTLTVSTLRIRDF